MPITRLNPAPAQYHVGDYYDAAWTAASSSANSTRLSDYITIPAGTYVVTIAMPVISTSTFTCGLMNSSGGNVGAIFCAGGSHMSRTAILQPVAPITICIGSAQSSACNFTYRERGGLRAVRIA